MPKPIRWAVLAALFPLAAAAVDDPAKVVLHESVTSAPVRFQVIRRLWADSWQSAFGTISYSTREEGEADFRRVTVDLGGDGVINFGCYRKTEKADASFVCNGTVVRYN